MCKGILLCVKVCGYDGEGVVSEKKEREGSERIMTPAPITQIRYCVPVCFLLIKQNVCDTCSNTGICIHCLLPHTLFSTVFIPVARVALL